MALIVTRTYKCDQCVKEIGRPYGPLIVDFGVDPDLFEGALNDLPSRKYFCDWVCAAKWMHAKAFNKSKRYAT